MQFKTRILSALALTVAAGSAAAQETTPVARAEVDPAKRMGMHFTSFAFKQTEQDFPPQKMLLLAIIAKQRVAAESCEGIEIDEAKYTGVMNAAMVDVMSAAEADAKDTALNRIMYAYGLIVGGEMAVAAYDPGAYCTFGEKLRAELEEDDTEGRVFVLKAAN